MRVERSYVVVAATTAAEGMVSFLLPPYLASVAFPVDVIGLLLAAGALASLASRLPAGVLYRGRRARRLLVASLGVGLITTLLIPTTRDPLAFAVLRALGGFAFGVATTVNLARFMETLPPGRDRVAAMGYFSASLAFGYMIGNGLGGFAGDLLGYPLAFTIAAGNFLLGVVVATTLPAPVRATAVPRERPPAASRPRDGRLRVLRAPGVLRVAVAAFLLSFMQTISGAFFPLFGLSVGLALWEVGIVRIATALTNVVTRGVGGVVVVRMGRGRVMHLGLALQGLGLMLLPMVAGFWPLFFLMTAVATFRAIVLVANTVALSEDIDETQVSRGIASGIYNASNDLGNVVAPALGGWVAALFGLGSMFQLLPPLVFALYLVAILATAQRGATDRAPAR